MSNRSLILILLISSSACASSGFLMAKPEVTLFGQSYAPKTERDTVEVFQTSLPSRPYIEFARIQCGDTSDSWNMKQILLKAREIGADGIIIVGKAGTTAVSIPIGNTAYGVSEGYGITAVAIKFKQ